MKFTGRSNTIRNRRALRAFSGATKNAEWPTRDPSGRDVSSGARQTIKAIKRSFAGVNRRAAIRKALKIGASNIRVRGNPFSRHKK